MSFGVFKNCGAAILCGGRSRRMGFDKALLLCRPDGKLLLSALAEELAGRFPEVILVTDELTKLARVAELAPYRMARDICRQAGPSGAIYTALAALAGRPAFIIACDMPVINWEVIEKMKALMDRSGAEVVVPRHGPYLEPLYGFYCRATRPVFQKAAAGNKAIRDSFNLLKTAYLDMDPDEGQAGPNPFKNINSIDDAYRDSLQLMGLQPVKVRRFNEDGFRLQDDLTVVEERVEIIINGRPFLSVMATPQHLDYLTLGLLLGEGVINSIEEVSELVVAEDRRRVAVTLSKPGPTPELLSPSANAGPGPMISPDQICEWMEEFNQSSGLFRATGAVHSVCFVNPANRGLDAIYDDVGRHNALDKVIGYLLSAALNPSSGLLLTTGRISTEILLKAYRAGLRVLISRSAPTNRAVRLALDLDMTLIGFARGRRFNVYSGSERVAGAGGGHLSDA
ncbi:MAG: formate dehydrogenase accessory sulfurtransferase FdhD [Candidatus Adiutrix sp.]|nr:formate dehydrogenase accessory sulfurtransferase FdhD [Candidatus Adiutrix sp.]